MASAVEVRNRILEVARDQFFSLGFTKVTMDEIAHELGMSKRTLYQHFPGKKDLLRQALLNKAQRISEGLGNIIESNHAHFGRKLEQALTFVATEMPHLSPIFLRDIQRHAPDVWQELDQRRQETIRTRFGKLIKEGIKAGFLRKDIEAELLVFLFSTLVQNVMSPETLSRLPLSASQAFAVISGVLFEGILTDKGRAKSREKES
ncbi:MAG: TetR/AcrR family transcriptional regulator [Acidobacteria bacterium]|nr:TetR/AcrR family transcriptional regulator [Acidobacteriota bacterium]